MKSMSVTFSVLSVILGIAAALTILSLDVLNPTIWDTIWALSPFAIVFAGLATLALTYLSPRFGNTGASVTTSAFICTTSTLILSTALLPATRGPLPPLGGAVLVLVFVEIGMVVLSFCLCPYLFIRTVREAKHTVVGVASAKDSSSVSEISRDTGLREPTVRKHLHDAVKKHLLPGRIEGDTYVNTSPVSRTRFDRKESRICPYCGAEIDAETPKCRNCSRDLSSAL